MNHDQQLGALQADMANVKNDVAFIRQHMVTRSEFERTASEHRGFDTRLNTLESEHDKHSFVRKLLDKAVYAAAGAALLYYTGVKM